MVYKLNVTEHANELLDNLVYHLIYRLKSKEAAKHLLDSVESIYDRLVENPYQFPKSRDMYLAKKGYYEAVIPQMNYIVIFDVRKKCGSGDISLYCQRRLDKILEMEDPKIPYVGILIWWLKKHIR